MKSGPKRPGTFQGKQDPRNGHGPPKGMGGRPTNEFVLKCGSIADAILTPKLEAYLNSHDPSDMGFRWAADRILEYGKGKPVQPVGPAVDDSDVIPFTVRIVD